MYVQGFGPKTRATLCKTGFLTPRSPTTKGESMKHSPSILILSLLLGACSHQGKLNTALEAEQAAWQTASVQIKEQCGHFADSSGKVPREKTMENNACETKILRETLLPVAVFPEEVSNLSVRTSTIAKQYKDGKIDREEANILMDAAEAEYSNNVAQKLRGAQQAAQQRDAEFSKSLQAFSDSLQPASAPPAIEAFQPASLPESNVRTTNCRIVRNSMRCTEM